MNLAKLELFRARPYTHQDKERVLEIAGQWVQDGKGNVIETELAEIARRLDVSLRRAPLYHYLVAELYGHVVGVSGVRPLALSADYEKMQIFAHTKDPAEFVNGFVDDNYRLRNGIGTLLSIKRQELARALGYTEVILNSGPRYSISGHPFHTKMYGEPVGEIPNLYGPGNDAKVWRKDLGVRDGI